MSVQTQAAKRTKRTVLTFAAVGFAVGFAAEYLYINLSFIERLAAEAGGFPLWSPWKLPFAVPGGIAGAALGAASAVVIIVLRRSKSTDPSRPGSESE